MGESLPENGEQAGLRRMLVVAAALVVVPLAVLALFAFRATSADDPVLATAATPGEEPAVPLPPEVPRADLAVTLRPAPGGPEAGRPSTDTLVVTSKGPATTRRTTVVETLPPGFLFRSAAAPPGTRCTAADSTVTCTGPGMRPGESRTIRVTAQVADRTAAGPARRVARAWADLPDPAPRDGVAVDTTRVARNADLVATVAPGPAVLPGARATLRTAVVNRGPATADGVVLAAVLPPGVTVLSASVPGGTCTPAGPDVSCSLPGPLPPGAAATASVAVAVDAAYAGDVMVPAVTATSTTPDPRPVGSTGIARMPVAPRADVTTTTTGPSALVAGGEGTWETVVTNRGPSTARDVTLGGAARGATVTDVDTSSGTCSRTGDAPGCTIGTLAPGESARVRTVAAIPAGAPAGPVRLTARARTSTPTAPAGAALRTPADDTPRPAPQSGLTTTTGGADGADPATTAATPAVARVADLAVAFSQGRPDDLRGTLDLAGDFTVRGRNLGPSDATDAVLSAVVPPGFRPTTVSPGCLLEGQRVTCRYPRLPADGEVAAVVSTAQPPGLLPEELTGPRELQATVSSAEPDPSPQNDIATATTGPPLGGPDLAVTAVDPAPRATAGDVVRRTVTVRNSGTAASGPVVLDDALAPGVVPVALPPQCRATAQATSCDLGALAAGEARSVTLAARLAPDRPPGPITRGSVARLAGDPSPSDNVTSSSTTVDARADLRTVLTRVGDGPVLAGGPATTYRVRTVNAGPSIAPGVVLDLGTPATGRRVLGATTGTGSCTVRAASALCPVAPLAPGDAAEAVVTVAAAGDLPGVGTPVTAGATSMVPDPSAADARAVETAPVARAADLRTRIDPGPGGTATAGSRTTYRVALTDAGPSAATRAVLSATLPPGAVAVSATSTRGVCTLGPGRVDCPVGDLPAGGGAVATIVAEVAPDARGSLALGAAGTSATPDPAPGAPSTLALPVVPAPTDPPGGSPDTAGLPGLDPRFPAPTGPGEGLTIAARIGRLPTADALGLVLAGAAIPAVLGGLLRVRRRRRHP